MDLERQIAVVLLANNSSSVDSIGFEVLKALQQLK
jgi:hypothetical protein